MSANNQTLVKEYQGKWLVFENVNAESWCSCEDFTKACSCTNRLNAAHAAGVYNSRDEAFEAAWEHDEDEDWGGTEYGVQFNRLCKDDAEVEIYGDLPAPKKETQHD